MTRLEFFFDCSSPWTYLAFHKIEELAEEAGAELIWRPILVGGVFNAVNQEVYEARANPNPRRARYQAKDLADWARLYELQIGWPDVFPVNSVKAMRGALVAQDAGRLPSYARATFERYWGAGEDISQQEVLASIAEEVGLDPGDFLEAIATPSIKDRLRANTDELIERGGFGSPTMFVGGNDMFFGNDRLPLVRAALDRHV
ncbi:MAG: 2-hydroxychromene-2-carboxylate isomerase [Deltaproteobacteria bacterium]|nr:2-hydroxychromene-2-carboxylate isomerase [Deltaproteobacteria bacterium]MBW2396330.1 2-hydroxychromene-2-carboxylate isomerase [Deltaproteobacteria bacterium]